MSHLRLGTRGSPLAMFQAHAVAAALLQTTGTTCDIVVIKTSGDRLSDVPLADIGGKRLFVKEIEDALHGGSIDLAVHSSKDMPAVLPDGLRVAATLAREDARDALVLPSGARADADAVAARLHAAPRIGTSSVRRVAQLARQYPTATFLPIRGNLDTRLRKLDGGDFDAIVLAAAGLRRLEQAARISSLLPVDHCVPAPGQGIIAIEVRSGDTAVESAVHAVDDPAAHAALDAERAVVAALGGGCQMPIGAHATVSGHSLSIIAVVISPDGARCVDAHANGAVADATAVGTRAAEALLAQGAGEILAEVQRMQDATRDGRA